MSRMQIAYLGVNYLIAIDAKDCEKSSEKLPENERLLQSHVFSLKAYFSKWTHNSKFVLTNNFTKFNWIRAVVYQGMKSDTGIDWD